jgi:hypothetical protein
VFQNSTKLKETQTETRIQTKSIRPFKCHLCLSDFKHEKDLVLHNSTSKKLEHTPLVCDKCSKRFRMEIE